MGHEDCGFCNHVPCICKKTKRIAEDQGSPNNPFGPNFPTYEGQCPYPIEYDSTDGACPSWWRGQDRTDKYIEELRTERDRLKAAIVLVRKMLNNPHIYRTESGLISDLLLRALESKT